MESAHSKHVPCALQLIRLTLTTISVAFLRNTWPVTSERPCVPARRTRSDIGNVVHMTRQTENTQYLVSCVHVHVASNPTSHAHISPFRMRFRSSKIQTKTRPSTNGDGDGDGDENNEDNGKNDGPEKMYNLTGPSSSSSAAMAAATSATSKHRTISRPYTNNIFA